MNAGIKTDNSLTQTEKGILLGVLSVNTYSSRYWDENFDRLKKEWVKIEGNAKGGPCFMESYSVSDTSKKILKADIAGAVSGGVAGAVIGGTVATPVGSVPGYVAGAVTGAVGGSVYEAVSEFLDWLF